MRGDRPSPRLMPRRRAAASPHARGSTVMTKVIKVSINGFPACAGIDLLLGGLGFVGTGLPRMRGDRPGLLRRLIPHDAASPHARGSTLRGLCGLVFQAGFPACAGIDPLTSIARVAGTWLPRMRGDRPQPNDRPQRSYWASPHARGSTHAARRPASAARGFPACAGIDLMARSSAGRSMRLPRMRGDRPEAAA